MTVVIEGLTQLLKLIVAVIGGLVVAFIGGTFLDNFAPAPNARSLGSNAEGVYDLLLFAAFISAMYNRGRLCLVFVILVVISVVFFLCLAHH